MALNARQSEVPNLAAAEFGRALPRQKHCHMHAPKRPMEVTADSKVLCEQQLNWEVEQALECS